MISIVIPTYNEAETIAATIASLWRHDQANLVSEIIVSDGGSTDDTPRLAESEGVRVVHSPQKGRAAQMNYGALQAKAPVLYFLHADTVPPKNFSSDILASIKQGFNAGCYMLAFDHKHWFLQANCWFTRFDVDAIRFGDQSLFVTRSTFEQAGGFCENHVVLEDQHIIKRLKKMCRFKVIKKPVITSARKYLENGIYKTQAIFFIIYFMYRLGYPQHKLVSTYRRLITQNKV